jgi:IS5 family transposase
MKKRVKAKAQKGFFDEENRREEIAAHRDPLKRLSVVDWRIFRSAVETCFAKEPKGPGGRPPFDYLLMFKALILQRAFNISDEQLEFQIKDRISFQSFLGLALADKVPDANTVWAFREVLIRNGGVERLFTKFDEHLRERGLIMKSGSIVDASFSDVPRQRNSREENKIIAGGNIPDEWEKEENANKRAQKDIDARWTQKNGERHFGYKNHVKIDAKSKLITKYAVTDASVHDSKALDSLIDKEDVGKPLYGDSAYRSEEKEKELASNGIISKIHERAYRNKPLNDTQKKNNKKKSNVRARIEHVFGFVEKTMGGPNLRCIGKIRATGIIGLMNLTYNLFRFEQITRLSKKRIDIPKLEKVEALT